MSPSLNNEANTPLIVNAINKQVQLGPSTQTFPKGLYAPLNYRIAILLPNAYFLKTYRGEQLKLKYNGRTSIMQGGGNSPREMRVLGTDLGEVPARVCRSPLQ